jgi:hypothetical protein
MVSGPAHMGFESGLGRGLALMPWPAGFRKGALDAAW